MLILRTSQYRQLNFGSLNFLSSFVRKIQSFCHLSYLFDKNLIIMTLSRHNENFALGFFSPISCKVTSIHFYGHFPFTVILPPKNNGYCSSKGGFLYDGTRKLDFFLEEIRKNCIYFSGFRKQEYSRTQNFILTDI